MTEDILVTAIGKSEANAASCAVDGGGRRSFSQSGKNGAKPDAQGFQPRPHIPTYIDSLITNSASLSTQRGIASLRRNGRFMGIFTRPSTRQRTLATNNPIEDFVRGCHAREDVHSTGASMARYIRRCICCEVNEFTRSMSPALRSLRLQHTLEPSTARCIAMEMTPLYKRRSALDGVEFTFCC